jgi:hypothetical protein
MLVLSVAFAAVLGLFTGCSTDSTQILKHPGQAKPGDVIDVQLTNAYVYLSNSSRVFLPVSRDSLHVAVALPDGWEVESIGYYVASHFKVAKYAGQIQDTAALREALMDSLAVFKTRQQALPANQGMKAAFAGRTIEAHDTANDSTIMVMTDSLDWLTYRTPIGIQLAMGSKVDTAFAIDDSLLAGVDTSELNSLPVEIDTIGMTVIPIFVFATIKTGTAEGTYNLFYFTKTGPLGPAEIDTSDPLSGVDRGDMAFYTISLDPDIAVRHSTMAANSIQFSAYPNPFTDKLTISSFNTTTPATVGIYSTRGDLVKDLTSGNSGRSTRAVWDGTDRSGTRVKAGSYVLKVSDSRGSSTRLVKFVD